MPIVEVNGQEIEFPDNMSQDQIRGVLQKKFPAPAEQPKAAPTQAATQTPMQNKGSLGERAGKIYGIPRTAFDQSMQGATFGFADEVSDPLGALYAAARENPRALLPEFLGGTNEVSPELADELSNARANTQKDLAGQMEQNPVTSVASQIAGAMLTGGAGASTKAGKTVGNFIRSGNIGARVAKGALAGAASGGVYGYGSGVDGERNDSAYRGSVLGAGLGAAAPVLGYAISGAGNAAKGVVARNGDKLDKAISSMKEKSAQSYQKMRSNGAEFSPQASQNILNKISTTLSSDGRLNPKLHDKTLAVFEEIQNDIGSNNLSLEGLDQWRQVLGDIASNQTDKVNARKAGLMIDAIDESVGALKHSDLSKGSRAAVDALNSARKQWASARKFEMVADVLKRADGDPNKIKSGLKSLLNSKKAVRGFSPAEYKSLQNAARYTSGEGIIKAIGKFGFDLGTSQTMGNTALPVLSGLAVGASNGGLGVAVPVIGTAARVGQKMLARGKAEDLLKVIESGGNVPMKQIMALPPAQAKKLMNVYRSMQNSFITTSPAIIQK